MAWTALSLGLTAFCGAGAAVAEPWLTRVLVSASAVGAAGVLLLFAQDVRVKRRLAIPVRRWPFLNVTGELQRPGFAVAMRELGAPPLATRVYGAMLVALPAAAWVWLVAAQHAYGLLVFAGVLALVRFVFRRPHKWPAWRSPRRP